MSAFADKPIKCIECSKDFVYTAAEQELHKSLGYQNEPKRCNPCREAKRQRRPGGRERGPAPEGAAPAVPQAPPLPREPNRQQGGGRPPQPPRDGGRRDGRGPRPPRDPRGPGVPAGGGGERINPNDPGFVPREFFLAICAECGKEAQLPFKPGGDRPVYCIDCFAQKRTG